MARVSGKFKPLLFFAVVLLLFTLRLQLCAAATTPDGFDYTTSGSEATITGYSGPGGDITIPGTINDGIDTYTVVRIDSYALNTVGSITGVTIPDTVTSIGEFAFQGCNMSGIDIPDTVTNIGPGAFGYCNNLTSVTLGSGLDSLSILMFQGCSSLTSVTIPSNITSIGNGAFNNCTGLTEVTIPNSVTTIGPEAFKSCHSLTSITIPDSITSIDIFLFQNCTGLQSVSIPSGVTEIGGNSFERCTSLESVTFPDSVTSIGDAAFSGCTSLSEANFLGDAPTLGNIAFDNCAADFTIYYPDGKTGYFVLWYGYPTAPTIGGIKTLAISWCDPAPEEARAPADENIVIGFNRDIAASNAYEGIQITDGEGVPIAIVRSIAWNTLQLDPESSLEIGSTFTVLIPADSVVGADGSPLATEYSFIFTTAIPLEITATNPVADATGVPINTNYIYVHFSEYVIEGDNFTQSYVEDSNGVQIDIGRYIGGADLMFYPVDDLVPNMTYAVFVPAGCVKNISGIPNPSDFTFSFTTTAATPLVVISTDPVDGQTDIPIDQDIVVTFNQNILEGVGSNFYYIKLRDSNNWEVSINRWRNLNTLVIEPMGALNEGMTYTVSVPAGSVRSADGVPLTDALTFSFTTHTVGTLEVIDSAPADGSTDVAPGTSITITFGENIAAGDNWGNVSLQDANGNWIWSDKNIDGAVLTIAPYDNLAKGMTYTVSLPSSSVEGVSGSSLTSPYSFSFTTILPTESDMYQITTDRNNATITGYSGPGGEITIPGQITKDGKTYNVTGLATESFGWRDDISTINIPASVTNIDVWAFNMSVNLAELNVSSGNKKYSSVAGVLYNKGKDTLVCYPPGGPGSFAIPNYVKTIGDSAFTFMGPRLYEITIPNSVKTIGNHAFENNAIFAVIIPSSVTSIGYNAFANCGSLTEVTIGKAVTRIGDYAFASCSSLGGIIIPNSVTKLGIWAFADCYSLQSVKIGNGVTSIGECTFQFCGSLETVVLGKSVTSIGPWAFIGCSSLNSINFPNGLTSIGEAPFEDCTSLTSLEFPNSLSSIGIYAFNRCSGLESVTIPKNITNLSEGIFQGCSGLTSVTIPKGVTSIGSYAFYTCSGLEAAKFLGSAPTMGDQVFDECSPDFKVFYIASSKGFTDPWYGYPTEITGK